MTEAAHVYIVDDDKSVRDSLSWLVESLGIRTVAYGSAGEFLAAYDGTGPACLVTDVRMPNMSGLELQSAVLERGWTLPVIFITAYGNVPMAVSTLQKGAIDFLEKPFEDQALLDRIGLALTRDREARRAAGERSAITAAIARLTKREREVMHCVVAGRANKVIAAELGISIKTVEAHREQVMHKMGAGSLAELVRMAMQSDEFLAS